MRTQLLHAAALLCLITAPAFAQTPAPTIRKITNADVGKPVLHPHTLTSAEWSSLLAHQFVYVPKSRPEYGGARVGVSSWTMPTAAALERPTYPLQTPFFMSAYVGPTIGVVQLGPDGVTPRR